PCGVARIRDDRCGFDDWILIGKALAIGRTEALAFAQTNKPQGSRYNAEMNQWLRAAGLDGVSAPDSCRLAAAPNFGSLAPRADIAPIQRDTCQAS
ncbi:MAG: hypothetical protein WCF53_06500, partial [Pseudolabrys sp.]